MWFKAALLQKIFLPGVNNRNLNYSQYNKHDTDVLYSTSDAFSPSAMYPDDCPVSSIDSMVPLDITDANRQAWFETGSQLFGNSTHSLVLPQPAAVIFNW